MRAHRDTNQDTVGRSMRLYARRLAEAKENRFGLERIKRRPEDYEPWQRGLLQTAAIWRDEAMREALEKEQRASLRRARAAIAARQKRGQRIQRKARRLGGRPRTTDTLLLRAGVSTHKNWHVRYSVIAAFLVDTVAKRLPKPLRERLIAPGKPALQKFRLAQSLRQASSRLSRRS